MYYTIYKTTNLINGKYYIGKHQTEILNDDYLGSGIYLRRAIKKYGIKNFVKNIIMFCVSEKQMNLAERILVVPDKENYNLAFGGQGSFSYLNTNREIIDKRNKLVSITKKGKPSGRTPMLGKQHSAETKQRMSKSHSGEKHHFFGKKHSPEHVKKMRNAALKQNQKRNPSTGRFL